MQHQYSQAQLAYLQSDAYKTLKQTCMAYIRRYSELDNFTTINQIILSCIENDSVAAKLQHSFMAKYLADAEESHDTMVKQYRQLNLNPEEVEAWSEKFYFARQKFNSLETLVQKFDELFSAQEKDTLKKNITTLSTQYHKLVNIYKIIHEFTMEQPFNVDNLTNMKTCSQLLLDKDALCKDLIVQTYKISDIITFEKDSSLESLWTHFAELASNLNKFSADAKNDIDILNDYIGSIEHQMDAAQQNQTTAIELTPRK